jgi:hypothetical protein
MLTTDLTGSERVTELVRIQTIREETGSDEDAAAG